MSNTLQNASPVAESVVHIRTIVSGELEQETRALDREVLALAGREHLVWVDLISPTRAMLQTLQEVYNLHPLAIREVSQRHRVSGVSFFDEITHVVLQIPSRSSQVTRSERRISRSSSAKVSSSPSTGRVRWMRTACSYSGVRPRRTGAQRVAR